MCWDTKHDCTNREQEKSQASYTREVMSAAFVLIKLSLTRLLGRKTDKRFYCQTFKKDADAPSWLIMQISSIIKRCSVKNLTRVANRTRIGSIVLGKNLSNPCQGKLKALMRS